MIKFFMKNLKKANVSRNDIVAILLQQCRLSLVSYFVAQPLESKTKLALGICSIQRKIPKLGSLINYKRINGA
jgi:hypothetical protein